MADIVDAFVVSLGIDPSNYNREIRQYRDDRKRMAEDDKKYNRDQEDSQRRLTTGFRTLRNEAAGFVLLLAGANGIKSFATDILSGDAATGRFANNLGLATGKVRAWEEAIKNAGGSAESARGALGKVLSAYQALQLTGTTGNDADWVGLGLRNGPSADPTDTLLQLSDASQRMPRAQFAERMGRLGFDAATINLLSQGRQQLQATLREMERVAPLTDQNVKAAIEFDKTLNALERTLKAKARPAVDNLASGLSTLLANQENLNTVTDIGVGVLGAAAIAAGVAYAPFFALAGVIAVLAANFDKSNWSMNNWSRTASGVTDILNGKVGSGLGKLWDELKEEGSSLYDDAMDAAGAPDRNGRAGRQAGRAAAASTGGFLSRGAAVGATNTRGVSNRVLSTGAGGTDPEIYRVLAARYGAERARGITAGIHAEGGSLGMAANGAFGIGQWRGPRQRALFRKYGPNPTKAQQLEFLMSELDGGDVGGAAVLGQSSAYGAAERYIGAFMRPGPGYAGDMNRVRAALGVSGRYAGSSGGGGATGNQTTNVGTINIYTAAKDANGIARDIRPALAKRGLVVQAGSGLQP